MPEISRPSTAPGTSRRPSGPRRTWLLVLPLLVWAGLAVVTVFVHRFVPEPRWLLVHVPALGLVTHAILVFMNYFADALLHAPRSSTRRTAWLFVPLDAGILLVVAGMLTGRSPWLLVTGGVLVAGAVLVDVGVLARQLRRSLRSRFALSLRYYLAAGTCLGLGVAFGVVMGITGEERGGFWLTHVSLMLLGWVGLTIAGTLLTFFPTVWRTRIPAGANADFARAWWWLVTGLLVMSFSGWFSTWLGPHAVEVAPTSSNPFAWTFLAGTVLHLVGVIQVTWVCVRALDGSFAHPRTAGGARTAAPSRISFAPVSITLGLVWWVVTLAMLLGYGVFHPTIGALAAFGRDLTAPFLVGFVLQVVMGALSHLLAVLVPGGPATTKLVAGIMDAGRWSRLGILNLCGTVFLLPVPSVVKVTTSFAVFGVLVAFLVLLVRALLAARRATRRTVSSPEAPTRSADPAGSAPVGPGQSRDLRGRRVRTVPVASPWKGLASGLIGSVAVLALAVSTAATIDPVSVTGGAGIEQGSGTGRTTTVHMSMVDMTFSPSTLEVPAGNRLVIEVSNDDPAGQVHDLTLANGATSGKLSPGESATVDAGVITEDMEGWCAVAGHRQMGMTFTITATGGTSDDGVFGGDGSAGGGGGRERPGGDRVGV